MQKVTFVDRDGTVILGPERPEGTDPRETFPLASADQVSFMDGAIEGLKHLLEKGYKLVLATNQTFLGTTKHPRDIFDQVMDRMTGELKQHGIAFDFVMVCPHGPDEWCDCRKPKTGGVKKYIETLDGGFDTVQSLMFGDRATDGEFANNLGVRFVKIETNNHFSIPVDL